MAVLYTASMGDLTNVSIDTATRKIQSDIRYAHHLARTTGVNHGVIFTAGGGYEVYRGSPGTPATDPLKRQSFTEDLSKFTGVYIQGDYQVEFNTLGKPVIGGDSYVRLNADGGAVRDVYIVADTGAVVIDIINYGSGCSCTVCAI